MHNRYRQADPFFNLYFSICTFLVNNVLEPLGLTVKAVGEGGVTLSLDGEKRALKKAVFVAVLKEPPTLQELRTSGWRIDDVAILATSYGFLHLPLLLNPKLLQKRVDIP